MVIGFAQKKVLYSVISANEYSGKNLSRDKTGKKDNGK